MIQRIQTVYLALAVICLILCACLPIANLEPLAMGPSQSVYCLCVTAVEGKEASYGICPMFIMDIIAAVLAFLAIFKYKNRKTQMSMCICTMIILVAWYIVLGAIQMTLGNDAATLNFEWPVALPMVAIIFTFLARKWIQHDEKLVRAADRIR